MITFSTLLLGLVLGNYPVKVSVGPEVKSVEYRLDGVAIGTITGEPWTLWCNFGPELHPHELVVTAKDVTGKVIGKAQQWVNLPRPSAEAHLLLERSSPDRNVVAVRISCDSAMYSKPKSVRVTLDGQGVPVKDIDRIELPPYDPKQIHVINVELRFPNDLFARADGVFGGDVTEEERTELTAVPIVLESINTLPPTDELQGWFTANGKELRVVGSELGVADLVVVFDQSANEKLYAARRLQASSSSARYRLVDSFESGDCLFIQFALPQVVLGKDGYVRNLLPISQALALDMDMLYHTFANITFPFGAAKEQKLTNATAIGGQYAASHNHRRAVVVVVNETPVDGSSFKPEVVKGFLRDLRVPMYVWSLASGEDVAVPTLWGPAESVGSKPLFDRAAARLKMALNAQRIVWIDGAHLPQTIRLSEKAKGIRIAS